MPSTSFLKYSFKVLSCSSAVHSHAFFLRLPLPYANCFIAQLPISMCNLSGFHTLIIMDLNSYFPKGNLANKFKNFRHVLS